MQTKSGRAVFFTLTACLCFPRAVAFTRSDSLSFLQSMPPAHNVTSSVHNSDVDNRKNHDRKEMNDVTVKMIAKINDVSDVTVSLDDVNDPSSDVIVSLFHSPTPTPYLTEELSDVSQSINDVTNRPSTEFTETLTPTENSVLQGCVQHSRGEKRGFRRVARIACLLPFAPARRLFSVHHVRPAIDLALQTVAVRGMLTGLAMEVSYRDSKCSISDGMNEAVNFYATDTADVFFGPTCDYAAAPVARQVRYWNKALVTAGAMAGDFGLNKFDMFPLLTRVGASFNSLFHFVLALLTHFRWKRLKLVYDPDGFVEIMDRYCHIAMDALHHGLRMSRALGLSDVIHDYYKFDNSRHAAEDLHIELGDDFSARVLALSMQEAACDQQARRCLHNAEGSVIEKAQMDSRRTGSGGLETFCHTCASLDTLPH